MSWLVIATIGRMTTVTSATFSRHIARAQDERKIQSCGARIADIYIIKTFALSLAVQQMLWIIAHTEKGESHDFSSYIVSYLVGGADGMVLGVEQSNKCAE